MKAAADLPAKETTVLDADTATDGTQSTEESAKVPDFKNEVEAPVDELFRDPSDSNIDI